MSLLGATDCLAIVDYLHALLYTPLPWLCALHATHYVLTNPRNAVSNDLISLSEALVHDARRRQAHSSETFLSSPWMLLLSNA